MVFEPGTGKYSANLNYLSSPVYLYPQRLLKSQVSPDVSKNFQSSSSRQLDLESLWATLMLGNREYVYIINMFSAFCWRMDQRNLVFSSSALNKWDAEGKIRDPSWREMCPLREVCWPLITDEALLLQRNLTWTKERERMSPRRLQKVKMPSAHKGFQMQV